MRQNTTASHIYFFYRSYIIQQYSPNDNSYCQFAYFSLLRGIMQTLAAWWGAGKGGGAGERSFCSDQRALSGQARTPRGGGTAGEPLLSKQRKFQTNSEPLRRETLAFVTSPCAHNCYAKINRSEPENAGWEPLDIGTPPPIQPPHSFFVLHCRIVTLSCIRGLECWL